MYVDLRQRVKSAMNYTPPPPEIPLNRPPMTPSGSPEQSYQPVPTDLYASYGPPAPQGPYSGYPPQMPPAPVPTTSGCRWGCILVLVAMFAVVALVGALILATLTSSANAFGGIGSGIGNILNTWANAFNPPHRVIVLPQVERLQKLAELTTVKFNYAGLVTLKQDVPPVLAGLYGNELVLVAVVSVRAGIDMSRLKPEDIIYDEKTNALTLHMPPPVLQECFLDDSKTYVAEQNTGVLVGSAPALDDQARRYAIQQFRDQALEEKILEEAQKQAEIVMRDFTGVLNPTSDAPTIQFVFDQPDPNAIPPVTCQ